MLSGYHIGHSNFRVMLTYACMLVVPLKIYVTFEGNR